MPTEPSNIVFSGLGTISFHVSGTGVKNVKGKLTLPNLIEGAADNSHVVVTINLNGGSAFYTGLVGAEGFESGTYATAGDTINVVLTSSAAVDLSPPQIIKSVISFY